ncbi:hypothetical protein [Deinococcus arcticus]|uniref:Uncharacterized protein n=1 Tax=Deinococcus arcticus TaxID=2136176 RepID=A0A2T3W9V6_9DEIO|nr:hypothetical protein [Deinococcus arcticus]PTA68602.1 hypothetical protein C8263_07370 [Deinococcus arcticus]
MAYYEERRKLRHRDARLTRAEAISFAMHDLWLQLLAPYRVFSDAETPDGVVRWKIALDYNDKQSDVITVLWELQGEHRERDAVRLSSILRNEFMRGVREGQHNFSFQWPDPAQVRERGVLLARLNERYPSGLDEADE